MSQREMPDGRWLPSEPMPEPFGVLWGRLWHGRRYSGEWKLPALIHSWLDARAITKAAAPPARGTGHR